MRKRTFLGTTAAAVVTAATVSGLTGCSEPTAQVSERAASSTTSYIKWKNDLPVPITFRVTETSNYDWDGGSRPDHWYPEGIEGYTLKPGEEHTERLEVNDRASDQSFNLQVIDSAGRTMNYFRFRYDESWGDWTLENETLDIHDRHMFAYTDPDGDRQLGELLQDFPGDDDMAFSKYVKPAPKA